MKSLFRPRSDWNHLGPVVPLSFRLQLKKLDPLLRLQFIPPKSLRAPRGVDPRIYPGGVWFICKELPKSRCLHALAVWSLTGLDGRYVAPGAETIKLLRLALSYQRRNQMDKLERMMDLSLSEHNNAAIRRSRKGLRASMKKFCSLYFDRQWNNRVSLNCHQGREIRT